MSKMPQVPPKGPTVKGFDIYHGDNVSLTNLSKDMKFCFHKATDGINFIDPMLKKRWPLIEQAGMIRGAYHFFHPKYDPIQQAKFFADVIGPMLTASDLIIMDWESTDQMEPNDDVERGYQFLQAVEKLLLKKPIIYTGPYFAEEMQLDARFSEYKLWIAEYGVSAPRIPTPWTNWSFWQTNDNGLDVDLFNGTIDELRALCANNGVGPLN